MPDQDNPVPEDEAKLTTLARFPSEGEANALVSFLADRGIPAQSVGGFTAGFIAEAPGDVKVLVREADLAAARIAQAELARAVGDIDWDHVDVGTPEEPT